MRILVALALLVLTAAPAAAQEGHKALAVRAVEAGYARNISTSIMATFWPAATELIRLRVPDLSEVQMFQYRSKTTTFAEETASAALAPMVDLFDKGFSDAELETVIAFYESPAGRKYTGAQSVIAGIMTGAVAAALKAEIATFQAKIDAMLAADGF